MDASLDIGTGHVMRCLSLADQINTKVDDIVFVSQARAGNLDQTIRQRGYRSVSFNVEEVEPELNALQVNPYLAWLGTSELEDAKHFVRHLDQNQDCWVVADHYALGLDWERAVRAFSNGVIAFDDLANRHHDCDVLIDSCPGRLSTVYDPWVNFSCQRLVGSEYAILRSEFARLRERSINRRKEPAIRHILVTAGGVDRDNLSLQVLDAIDGSLLARDTIVTVVLGRHAPWFQLVAERCQTMKMHTSLLTDVTNMASLMELADLAIGAAGTTALERCCMGLPTIQIIGADNQKDAAAALEHSVAAITAAGPDLNVAIQQVLNWLVKHPTELLRMSERAAALVDGLGAQRVGDIIIKTIRGSASG